VLYFFLIVLRVVCELIHKEDVGLCVSYVDGVLVVCGLAHKQDIDISVILNLLSETSNIPLTAAAA
jgi:hypothetical protein